tara:strand:- start:40 stop:534 length:495 start_codon:yes stop_codon:yes gene_type:complete
MVRVNSSQEFRTLQRAVQFAKTDDEYKKLGFSGNTFTACAGTKFSHETLENLEIDLTGAPIYNEVYTDGKKKGQPIKNRQYYKCFPAPKKDVSFYIPINEKLFLDTHGTTRPTKTEMYNMGGGTYMSDCMLTPLNQIASLSNLFNQIDRTETIKNNISTQLTLF